MKTKLWAVALVMLSALPLIATNHMDLMLSIRGAHESSMLFSKMTVIDFNGDGYDDLIMPQNRSTALSVYAKLYCYFGGPDFDDIPDLEYQGEFWDQGPGARLMSGDFNGDGYGDLLDAVPIDSTNSQMGLRFYYGGPGADLVPDHIIPMASLGTQFSSEFIIQENIGDINNDGCDDIGAYHITPDSLHTWGIAVIFGGSYQSAIVIDEIYGGGVAYVSHLGDVNGDGIDDFSVGYDLNLNPQYHRFLYIYYGNDGFWDPQDRIQVFEDSTYPYIYPFAFGIGDFNNDGMDDILMNWVIDINNSGEKIVLGSTSLPQSQEYMVDISPWTDLINVYEREVNFGDFNGDGYSDMVCSDHRSGFWNGAAGIWLGGANPNGRYDLRITPPPTTQMYQFGWGTPAVGDFNADGYDDVAFLAPQSQHGTTNYRGWVHIYAGNSELTDTTVANEDEVNISESIKLSVFPNPSGISSHDLNYSVEGDSPSGMNESRIDIYNIRGQLVATKTLQGKGYKQGVIQKTSLARGVYIASIVANEHKLATTKFTIK